MSDLGHLLVCDALERCFDDLYASRAVYIVVISHLFTSNYKVSIFCTVCCFARNQIGPRLHLHFFTFTWAATHPARETLHPRPAPPPQSHTLGPRSIPLPSSHPPSPLQPPSRSRN